MWALGVSAASVEAADANALGSSTYPRIGGVVSVVSPAAGHAENVCTWMSPSPLSCGSSRKVVARVQTIRCSGTFPAEMSSSRSYAYGPPGPGPAPCVSSIQRFTRSAPPSMWPHSVTTCPAVGGPICHQLWSMIAGSVVS